MEEQERPKKEAVHSKLLSGRLVRKLTKEPCLAQLQENYISASKFICIGVLEWVQSYIPSRWSPQHLPLSRLHPWNSFSGRKDRQSVHSEDQGRGEEPLVAQIQLTGQPAFTPF